MQDSLLELVEMLERSTSLLSTLLLVIRLRVESRVSIEGWKSRRKPGDNFDGSLLWMLNYTHCLSYFAFIHSQKSEINMKDGYYNIFN